MGPSARKYVRGIYVITSQSWRREPESTSAPNYFYTHTYFFIPS